MSRMMNCIDSPLFLCGHRKGGTTVALCLFDSHPELLVYPCDSAFFYLAFPKCLTAPKEATVEVMAQTIIIENLRTEMKVVQRDDIYDPEAVAATYRDLIAGLDHTPANHLKAMVEAYGRHCGQPPARWKRWVEKTTSTEIFAQDVASWFPKARFLHITRDPRDNYASLKSGWRARYQNQEASYESLIQSLIDRGGLGLRMAGLNRALLGSERYHVVRFEDLTEAPREHLEDICRFVGIDYDEALERPTVNGVLWPGNNFDGVRFQALSPVNVGRWHERIDREEVALIEGHLGHVMEDLGYETVTSRSEQAGAIGRHYKWFNSQCK